jgi:hypothetical protein
MAAAVCKLESGGNPNLASGVDVCSDGNPFSFGLFQINIMANYDVLGCATRNEMFNVSGSGTQGSCAERRNGMCVKYNCSVKDQTKYNACKQKVLNYQTHMQATKAIYDRQGWQAWGAWTRHCRNI